MLNVIDRAYLTAQIKAWRIKQELKEMWEEEKGGTATVVIEIVMIGMVLVLGYMFREKIGELLVDLWNKLVNDGDTGTPTGTNVTNPFGSGE